MRGQRAVALAVHPAQLGPVSDGGREGRHAAIQAVVVAQDGRGLVGVVVVEAQLAGEVVHGEEDLGYLLAELLPDIAARKKRHKFALQFPSVTTLSHSRVFAVVRNCLQSVRQRKMVGHVLDLRGKN